MPNKLEAKKAPRVRVLIAEDHAFHQSLERTLLEGLGCVVTVVANGLDATRKAQAEAFDVIVLDRNMPRLDGDAAARAIRLGRGASAGAVLVCCSTEPPQGEAALYYDAAVEKPVALAAISAMLDALPSLTAA